MGRVLFSKIQRLKEEIIYLVENKDKLLRNIQFSTENKKILERSVYLCAEMVLDIGDLLITDKRYPRPDTYSDIIYKLGEYNILPKEFAYKFVYIAGVRNFLAHDYEKDTIPKLEEFLKNGIPDIEAFLKYIED